MELIKLPKIELHCHLDGSVRPETIVDISKKENISIPSSDINIIREMMIAPLECKSLSEYLERFELPINIMQTKESLKRVAYELMEDAAKENIKYIEIRFAPLLHTKKGLTVEEIISSVLEGIKAGENNYDIKGNLILSCLRYAPVDTVYEVIEAGRKFLGSGVVAIDLCGNEEAEFCERYIDPIVLAREYGYRVTIHAGETGIGKNVLDAVKMLKAERIGHGVFIKDYSEAYDIVKDKEITLEMCPTSNIQTKAVNSYGEHPIFNFYNDGIKVTINTDNRTVSNTTLSNEYISIFKEFNLTYEDYKEFYYNSVDAAFINEETKEQLKKLIGNK